LNQLTKILITLFFVCLVTVSKGQNLVPNPSFEDTVSCPTTLADLSKTTFWSEPTQGSPDYFNVCTNNSFIDVPNNGFGSQNALSGIAYVGIQVYDTQSVFSYREYIQVQLQQTLTLGQEYWVSFYVSLSDLNDYGIQELGAYFSSTQISDNSMDSTLVLTPQIEFSDSVISSKNDWTKVSGSFVATGNESYIIIGNFNRKQTTTSSQLSSNNINYAYYYIDDVCVSSDSLTCSQPVGINEAVLNQSLFNIFPNPANNYINITKENDLNDLSVSIYNAIGQLLYTQQNITSNNTQIDISNYNSGLLFITITSNNNQFTYKLLKH
jgi:hypothetical protein